MGKIIIMEEKADKMISKLEKIKEYLCEVLDTFETPDDTKRYPEDDEDWDDEYNVKRRKGPRIGYTRGTRY